MRRVCAVLVGALWIGTGCSWSQLPFVRDSDRLNRGATIDSLQDELAFYASNFAGTVATAASDISDASPDRKVRKNALTWKLRMVPAMQRVAYGNDPRAGYVRALFVAMAQRQYLESGDGKDLFGPQQATAVDAANRLESDAIALGERFLTQTELRRVQAEEAEVVAAHPIVGREFSLQRASSAQRELQQGDVFSSVLAIPLSPFRALEGVDSGAQAIREFNVTARRFTGIAAGLPEQLRGELELFLYDVEDRDTVKGGLAALEQVGASADRLTAVAETLPEELRTGFDGAQGAIAQAREAVAELEKAVAQMREVAGPIDSAAQNLREGSLAWREVIGSRAEREANDDGDGRPFDIRDWENTATANGSAAGQLRGLAGDAETLADSRAFVGVVDRIFWRSVVLLLVFFGLLLVYRLIASRLDSRRAS
jgi:hypothetical protein